MPTMNFLRTLEQVFQQDGKSPIHLVAAVLEWEHYDSDECPTPIREWVLLHYPDVVIEQLIGIESDYEPDDASDIPDDFLCGLTPIFRLGFNAEQAEHFQQAWSNPPLDTPDSPTNFYFLSFYNRRKARQSRGVVNPFDPATVIPSG